MLSLAFRAFPADGMIADARALRRTVLEITTVRIRFSRRTRPQLAASVPGVSSKCSHYTIPITRILWKCGFLACFKMCVCVCIWATGLSRAEEYASGSILGRVNCTFLWWIYGIIPSVAYENVLPSLVQSSFCVLCGMPCRAVPIALRVLRCEPAATSSSLAFGSLFFWKTTFHEEELK